MKKKGYLLVIAMLLVAVLLSGCSSSANKNESKGLIGVIPKSTLYDYWQTVKLGAEEAAGKAGYEITFQGTPKDTDVAGQVQIVEDFITKGVKAIVIAPIDANSLVPVLEKADKAGIPVIIIDSVLNADFPYSTVLTNHQNLGAVAAEELIKLIGEEGKVAVVSGSSPGSFADDERVVGFTKKVEELSQLSIINTFYSEGDRNKATNITQDILNSTPDIKGIYTTNEGSTSAVALEIGKSGNSNVVVIGSDSSKELPENIKKGEIAGTVIQDPFTIGFTGADNAVKVLNGEEVEKEILIDTVYMHKENIDSPEIQKILNPLGK